MAFIFAEGALLLGEAFSAVGTASAEVVGAEGGALVTNAIKGSVIAEVANKSRESVEGAIDYIVGKKDFTTQLEDQVADSYGLIKQQNSLNDDFDSQQAMFRKLLNKKIANAKKAPKEIGPNGTPTPEKPNPRVPEKFTIGPNPGPLQGSRTVTELSVTKKFPLIIIGPNGKEPTKDVEQAGDSKGDKSQWDPLMSLRDNTIPDIVKMGKDLGSLIFHTTVEGITSDGINIAEILTKVSNKFPELDPVLLKAYKHQKNSDLTALKQDKASKIARFKSIHKGLWLSAGNVYTSVDPTDGLTIYNIQDQDIGRTYSYKQRKPYTPYIPPIWGTWVGPNSKNDNFPYDRRGNPQQVLDSAGLVHDTLWRENGNFHEMSDLIFISLLENNLDRMSYTEALVAKFSIKYFSTIGLALSSYKGITSNEVYDIKPRDGSVRSDGSIFNDIAGDKGLGNEDYSEMKDLFFGSVVSGLVSTHRNHFGDDGGGGIVSRAIRKDFVDNLMVEIL